MKAKRHARDRKRKIIEEGDIIQVDGSILAVVKKVINYGREEFPDLAVTELTTNFVGHVMSESEEIYFFEQYKKTTILNPNMLREEVEKFHRALYLREIILLEKNITNNRDI